MPIKKTLYIIDAYNEMKYFTMKIKFKDIFKEQKKTTFIEFKMHEFNNASFNFLETWKLIR